MPTDPGNDMKIVLPKRHDNCMSGLKFFLLHLYMDLSDGQNHVCGGEILNESLTFLVEVDGMEHAGETHS